MVVGEPGIRKTAPVAGWSYVAGASGQILVRYCYKEASLSLPYRDFVRHFFGRQCARDRLSDLTDREREVLSLMAEGRSNSGIARQLVLMEKTIETHSPASSQSRSCDGRHTITVGSSRSEHGWSTNVLR
jgi:hypothetical protein